MDASGAIGPEPDPESKGGEGVGLLCASNNLRGYGGGRDRKGKFSSGFD